MKSANSTLMKKEIRNQSQLMMIEPLMVTESTLEIGQFVYFCGDGQTEFEPGEYLKVVSLNPLKCQSVRSRKIMILEPTELRTI